MQPLTILFMGDSITEGQYVDSDLRWTNLVAERIRESLLPIDSDLHFFHNRGVSGETSRQGLERYPHDVQNVHPDIMTLQFGLNDCNCWDTDHGLPRVSEEAYRANLIEMIVRARHFGVKHIILSTNHRTLRHKTLTNGKTLEENRIRYNNIVRKIAVETGVTLCDIEKGFENLSEEELRKLLLPEPDVLHLSPEGHQFYGSLIYPYIVQAIEKVSHITGQLESDIDVSAKSKTDLHWNSRALAEQTNEKVNIGDTIQRELETKFILSQMPKGCRILEVGCGNGYLTKIIRRDAAFVDAFDYSENMIDRAKKFAEEKNNQFFCDNILDLKNAAGPYDVIVCVRVLINLQDLNEQRTALKNMANLLESGGKLILIEGYRDGFDALDNLRIEIGLPPLKPAGINFYSYIEDIWDTLEDHFFIGHTFHTGMFDFLTRIVYPLIVGPDRVREAGEFHQSTLPLTLNYNPDFCTAFGRLRGFELIKR